ncbi:MAG: large conductance mechanosensitive channel protein MscL [Acholeplasmataceae bacterium]
MKQFFKDFGTFIKRGNVLDLAVAVIIGGAFGKIVSSLVNDVIMPTVGWIVGAEGGFENLKHVITPANETLGIAEHAIYYGRFIQNIVDFIIIAFVIFVIIRLVSRANKLATAKLLKEQEQLTEAAKEKEVVEEQKPTVEELLTDIKDLLAKK